MVMLHPRIKQQFWSQETVRSTLWFAGQIKMQYITMMRVSPRGQRCGDQRRRVQIAMSNNWGKRFVPTGTTVVSYHCTAHESLISPPPPATWATGRALRFRVGCHHSVVLGIVERVGGFPLDLMRTRLQGLESSKHEQSSSGRGFMEKPC